MSSFEFDGEDASFAVRYNGKLSYLDFSAEDLGDWSGKQEFLRLLQDVSDDFDAEESLHDLISAPCIPLSRTTHWEQKSRTHSFSRNIVLQKFLPSSWLAMVMT